MSALTYSNRKTGVAIFYGVLRTVTAIALYKLLIGNIGGEQKEKWFTLILLITPVILYFTIRELCINHWGHQLHLKKVMLVGVISCVMTGSGVALLDWLILRFDISVFGIGYLGKSSVAFGAFLWAYVLWYLCIGLICTPCIYLLLKWKLKKLEVTKRKSTAANKT